MHIPLPNPAIFLVLTLRTGTANASTDYEFGNADYENYCWRGVCGVTHRRCQ